MIDSIKEKALKGLFWAVGERILTQGALFFVSIILARLLSPDEYGILALLLVFTNLADVLVTNGMGESLVQKKDVRDIDYSTVFVSALTLSALLYGVIYFCSHAIALFYGNMSIEVYLKVLALRVPLSALNAVQKAYISKNFMFRQQFYCSFLGSIISGAVAIAMAWLGFGVYALIAQQLLSLVFISVLLVVATKWIPHFNFRLDSFEELVPLGLQFCGSSLVNSLYTEGRSLLIGKFYSSSDLAFFNRGNQFPALIVDNLNAPLSNVMLPVLSEIKSRGSEIGAAVRKSVQISSFVVFPMMGILMASANHLIQLLLGSSWMSSVPYLQIACVFYIFQPLQSINWQVLKALGKGDLCIKLELIKKAACFLLLIVAVPHGVLAIAIASALSGLFSSLINMFPVKKLIGYGLRDQVLDILKPLFATTVVVAVSILLPDFTMHPMLGLIIQVIVGSLVYLVVSRLIECEGLRMILDKMQRDK